VSGTSVFPDSDVGQGCPDPFSELGRSRVDISSSLFIKDRVGEGRMPAALLQVRDEEGSGSSIARQLEGPSIGGSESRDLLRNGVAMDLLLTCYYVHHGRLAE
jgi:hypothetical protein